MKRNNTEGKGWLAAILIVMILCGMMAMVRAETATSTDTGETKPALEITGEMGETAGVSDASSDLTTEEPAETATPTPENTEPPTADPTATPEAPAETPAEQPSAEPTGTPDSPTEQPTHPPEETDPPADLKTLFDVDVKVPSAWRSDAAATVRIKITPTGSQMWHAVKVRQGDADWQTIRNKDFVLYEGYYYTDIEVSGNARMTVRLYGDEQNYFDTNKEIRLFDRHAPEVTAGFRDRLLHVEAADDLSGVAGIQVNSLLFTTLVDGVLDVRMEEPLQTYRQLAIRAYDYAGNFSAPVTLDNPYYMAPTPEPTQTPRPTAKPTKKPTKKPSGSDGKATATPAVTAAPVTQQPQIVYVTPDPALYSYTQPVTTPEPETVYVPLGPGQPYKSKGNMQTLDMLYSASTNKQFITVQTRTGETYYMVIDYDKPIDADNDIYETYFLNLVDDRDLLSVVSADEIKATPTPQIVYVTPEPTQKSQQTAPIVVEGDNEMAPTLLLIVGIAAVGGAAFWFVKSKKEKNARNVPDFDEYDFKDEDESDEG